MRRTHRLRQIEQKFCDMRFIYRLKMHITARQKNSFFWKISPQIFCYHFDYPWIPTYVFLYLICNDIRSLVLYEIQYTRSEEKLRCQSPNYKHPKIIMRVDSYTDMLTVWVEIPVSTFDRESCSRQSRRSETLIKSVLSKSLCD